jgi:cytochrome c peroxidase
MDRIKHGLLPALLLIVAGVAASSGLSALWTRGHETGLIRVGAAAQPDAPDCEPIHPIPRAIELDSRKVVLGRRLFHDPRLSADNSVSCAACHNLHRNGADDHARSVGVGGAKGDVNAPTVVNPGLNFRQFWDGRAETLEDQIDGPIRHPAEMGSDWPQILEKLRANPDYTVLFSAIYATEMDCRTIKDAIATFERSLITPDCRFDRYLRGDSHALTAAEKEGYRLFKQNGCGSCHQGGSIAPPIEPDPREQLGCVPM